MIRVMGNLSHEDEDRSSPSKSKVSKKKLSANNKNPYSETGLDKFSSVLADLRARKEMILATTGTQGVSMVRFIYKNSEDCVPIVVRMRDQQQQQEEEKSKKTPSTNHKNPYSERGLDKFSSVLADLREREEMILARAGAQGVSMVRFTYMNSQDCVPIIVRMRDQHQQQHEEETSKKTLGTSTKNPYSARGLDKFYSVLTDLRAREETILARVGAQGVLMVQFTYKNSQDCVPIVVRMRDQHQQQQEEENSKKTLSTNNKNPYSERGLDKFSTLLADHRAREETILARAGTQGLSMIQFTYKNSQDCVPVVVRMRDQHQQQHEEENSKTASTNNKNPYSERGLNKFSSVLADHRAREKTILASEGVSMVQFTYKNSQDCVPIVVRMRGQHQRQQGEEEKSKNTSSTSTNLRAFLERERREEMILAMTGAQGASTVQFMYKNSQDCVPAVGRMQNQHQQQEEEKSMKKPSINTDSKNPYSGRGLDKFSNVVADLRAREETILARPGAQGASMVQFTYKNSQDYVPIVLRMRDQQHEEEKSKKALSTNTNNKNPYSARGLDKFSSVLTDLKAREETILERAGAQGVSTVQFTYKNSQDCVPIVVRLQDQHQLQQEEEKSKKKPSTSTNSKNPYSGRGLDKFSSVLADRRARDETINLGKGRLPRHQTGTIHVHE